TSLFPQSIEYPSIILKDIDFKLTGRGYPDTLETIRVKLFNQQTSYIYNISVVNGTFDTTLAVSSTGVFNIQNETYNEKIGETRSLPGLISILPPALAILLALIFRQVLLSLIIGIFTGAFFIYGYDPLTAFLRLADVYIINALIDKSHMQVIVFTLMFGGVIGLISKSGGTRGIANTLKTFAKSRRSGLIATWLSGIIIFFDDYANTLIVGNLMKPVTDSLKISRAKLAFVVDATAAPIASIFIISSWIGFEVGLIQEGLISIGSSENAYSVFIETIPYRFYPIALIFFVFFLSYTQRDFGPMLRAERSASEGNDATKPGVTSTDLTASSELFGNENKAKWYNGIIPILVLIFGSIAGLIITGLNTLSDGGIEDYSVQNIIANSDAYLALLWSSSAACVVAAVMILFQRIMNLKETLDAWFLGLRSMFLAVLILTLAWAIGSVTQDIKTADYIISMISDSISPYYLPVIVFIVCGVISFSTGTSWGTMAIMFPIVIPLAAAVSNLSDLSTAESTLVLHGVISSVLTGCVWGDHCSPISDTTILSSMASGCDHIEHVRTQLPYAIIVAIITMLIGDIPTAFGLSPYISIALIFVILIVIVMVFGQKILPKKV
ncbi:MAG: Na+/H+ antiporter NhaC family protein, partial [Ignavibacteriaceae bacterium]